MDKPVKVLVIKGHSRYGQLRYESDEMIKGFSEQGCLVTILDLAVQMNGSLHKEWATEYDLIFSFNGIGADIYMDSEGEKKGLYWTFLVDHPFHLHSRLEILYGNVMVSCIDNNHVSYIDKYYPNITWTCFVPHGGITGETPCKPISDRKYEVVFMGSLADVDMMRRDIEDMRAQFAALVDPIVNICETDFHSELEDLVSSKMAELKAEVDIPTFSQIMSQMRNLDFYRRYIKRKQLIESLGEQGVVVDLWGEGWEKIVSEYPALHYHGKVSYGISKWIMADAKIVLSDIPLFHDGSHERIYASMQCGAVSVSDKSLFFEQTLSDGEELFFYDDNELDELGQLLKKILKDNERLSSVANAGHIAAEKENWKDRAAEIISIIGLLDKPTNRNC